MACLLPSGDWWIDLLVILLAKTYFGFIPCDDLLCCRYTSRISDARQRTDRLRGQMIYFWQQLRYFKVDNVEVDAVSARGGEIKPLMHSAGNLRPELCWRGRVMVCFNRKSSTKFANRQIYNLWVKGLFFSARLKCCHIAIYSSVEHHCILCSGLRDQRMQMPDRRDR